MVYIILGVGKKAGFARLISLKSLCESDPSCLKKFTLQLFGMLVIMTINSVPGFPVYISLELFIQIGPCLVIAGFCTLQQFIYLFVT